MLNIKFYKEDGTGRCAVDYPEKDERVMSIWDAGIFADSLIMDTQWTYEQKREFAAFCKDFLEEFNMIAFLNGEYLRHLDNPKDVEETLKKANFAEFQRINKRADKLKTKYKLDYYTDEYLVSRRKRRAKP